MSFKYSFCGETSPYKNTGTLSRSCNLKAKSIAAVRASDKEDDGPIGAKEIYGQVKMKNWCEIVSSSEDKTYGCRYLETSSRVLT